MGASVRLERVKERFSASGAKSQPLKIVFPFSTSYVGLSACGGLPLCPPRFYRVPKQRAVTIEYHRAACRPRSPGSYARGMALLKGRTTRGHGAATH